MSRWCIVPQPPWIHHPMNLAKRLLSGQRRWLSRSYIIEKGHRNQWVNNLNKQVEFYLVEGYIRLQLYQRHRQALLLCLIVRAILPVIDSHEFEKYIIVVLVKRGKDNMRDWRTLHVVVLNQEQICRSFTSVASIFHNTDDMHPTIWQLMIKRPLTAYRGPMSWWLEYNPDWENASDPCQDEMESSLQ